MSVTPRRSTRGLLFSPSTHRSLLVESSAASFTWASAPRNGDSSFPAHYWAVTRTTGVNTPVVWSRGRSLGRALDAARFEIGDAVAVSLQGGNEGIGIIIDLREEEVEDERLGHDEDEQDDQKVDEGFEKTRKVAEVHWLFQRDDLPQVMRDVDLADGELFLAASSTKPITSTVPLGLLLRTVTVKSLRPTLREPEYQPEAGPSTPTKKGTTTYGKTKLRTPVRASSRASKVATKSKAAAEDLWCTRAFDKSAKGGRSWRVNLDAWITAGKNGEGWNVEIPPVPPEIKEVRVNGKSRRRVEDDSSSDEGSAFGDGAAGSGSESGEGEPELEDGVERDVSTPRKRKRTTTTTPRKSKVARTTTKPKGTPRKRGGRKSALLPVAEHTMDFTKLPVDPYERALKLLHVGATPETLPCREEDFVDVLGRIEDGVEDGSGGCLYIAGVPGTGKTATVHAVVKELRRKAGDGELAPFSYVEINGLKIPSPQHAYVVLWEAISGTKGASAKTALRGLEAHFASSRGVRGPRGHTFVVLMDELDQLLTAKQDVVYNFFNWPTMRDSQLFVVAVANRMDLPQQLAAKIKSRLALQTLLFQPYDRASLIEIVKSRLVAHPNDPEGFYEVLSSDAIALAATKMAGTNGDARRVLDACRRAVEVALESTPPHPVTIREMQAVLALMSSSPVSLFLKQCSVQQKVMMAAVLRCVRREGIPEISWRSIRNDTDALTRSLLDSAELLSSAELALVLASLTASHAVTYQYDSTKALDDRKLALGMESGEVGRVLMNEGESWRRALAGT